MAGCISFDIDLFPDLDFVVELPQLNVDLCEMISSGDAFVNPLQGDIDDGVQSIQSSLDTLGTEISDATDDIDQLTTWESSPPSGWTSQEITDIKTSLSAKKSGMEDLQVEMNNGKNKFNTDFQSHTDRITGVDLEPENDPNFFALMGVETSVNIQRKQMGKPFSNEMENLFGSLYNGPEKLTEIKNFTDQSPADSIAELDLQNRIQNFPVGSDTKQKINDDVNNFVHQNAGDLINEINKVDTLINDDKAAYDFVVSEITKCLGSFSMADWLFDPWKSWLLDCIGSSALKTLKASAL